MTDPALLATAARTALRLERALLELRALTGLPDAEARAWVDALRERGLPHHQALEIGRAFALEGAALPAPAEVAAFLLA